MVRKKRKTVNTLVKTRGLASTNVPEAVDISKIDVSLSGAISLDLSTGSDGNLTKLEINLEQVYKDLLHAPDVYGQLKLLQLFRSHLKLGITACNLIVATSNETQIEFWNLIQNAFRFTFCLYVHPLMKSMRKTIMPILETFALYDGAFPTLISNGSIGDIIAEELIHVLQVVITSDVCEVESAVVYLDQILAICEFPSAPDTLWKLHTMHSPWFVALTRYCGSQLRFLSSPITTYHGKKDEASVRNDQEDDMSTQSAEVLLASERCLSILKSIIILCTAAQKASPIPPVVFVQTMQHETLPRSLPGVLEDLILQCIVILETSAVHKDLLTTVGLALTLMLKVHTLENTSDENAYLKTTLSLLFNDQSPSWMPTGMMSRLNDTSKLALYRGFLNSVQDISFGYLHEDKTPLVEVMFKIVLKHCQSAHLNVRMYAFQVLEMYLRRCVNDRTSGVSLSEATISSMVDIVLLNWEHPAKKINQFMAPLFTHVVSVLNLKPGYEWNTLLQRLLILPQHTRSKYIAVGILLPKLNVDDLLAREPTLLHGVLAAVGNQDVAASAACLFVQVLDALRLRSTTLEQWSVHWVDAVANSLLSSDAALRQKIAIYVLPVLVKSEMTSVSILLSAIRVRPVSDVRLWAMLELVKYARKTMEAPPYLTREEISLGLQHMDGDIRMAAFDLLCASLKTTSTPTNDELELIQLFLQTSAKSIAPSLRMKLIIGLKSILLRLRESSRKTCRRDGTRDVTSTSFLTWLEIFVINCITPGATPQRMIMGLEIMQLYGQIFDANSIAMHTPAITKSLLNAMVSCWDRVRALSFAILETFPSPLPGFENGMDSLYDWALMLCCSPRQRESDAGALFMRLLYKQYSNLRFLPSATQEACFRHLLSILSTRLHTLETSTDQSEPPLIHGLLLSLRFMLEDTESIDTWQNTIESLIQLLWRSMHLALCVVGDATSGVGTQSLDDAYAVVGEVLTTPQLRAKVDCRGHLIMDDPELADGDAEQRTVVGSWLAARETAAVMAALVKSILESKLSIDSAVQRAGDCLLNALFELKHGGAVATVSVAFEDICKALLQHSETHRVLAQSPSKWCDVLLYRLEHAEQQFILRRSAGFASSFVALLRSEPRNSAATMLPHVLSTLLRLASGPSDVAERVRVHALNILKLIGQDGVLAEDVAVYVPEMLSVAVNGFDSKSWAVRNSSMMLFAAATQRAIGDKQVADGAANIGVSSKDVFTRCVGLDQFLLKHLNSQVYPLLLFLSRLRPGDDHDGILSLDVFVPLVVACANDSHIFHRRMAAHALGAIIRHDDIPAIVSRLFDALQGPKFENNKLHGSLLQLIALVNKTNDTELIQKIVGDLVKAFPTVVALRCDTNRGVFFQLCYEILTKKLSGAGPETALWSLMVMHCKEACTGDIQRQVNPGNDLYLQYVAKFIARHGLSFDHSVLLHSVVSNLFELRRSSTTELYENMQIIPLPLVKPLASSLASQLLVESHPPTQTRQLALLSYLCGQDTETWHSVFVVDGVVDTLSKIIVDSVDPQMSAPSLELLAYIHHGLSSRNETNNTLSSILVGQMTLLSDEMQPLPVRLASAKSLRYSGILQTRNSCKNEILIELAISAWFAAIDLLQDDDPAVRDAIRDAIQSYFLFDEKPSEMKILPKIIEYISKEFKSNSFLEKKIKKKLNEWTNVEFILKESINTKKDLNTYNLLCEKIFQTESGNFFKQNELIFQLFLFYFIQTIDTGFILQRLESCLSIWFHSIKHQAWIGGTTFFPEIFSLFHNLILLGIATIIEKKDEINIINILKLSEKLMQEKNNMHPLLYTALEKLNSIGNKKEEKSIENIIDILYLCPQ